MMVVFHFLNLYGFYNKLIVGSCILLFWFLQHDSTALPSKSEDKQANAAPNVGGKSTIRVHHSDTASKQEVDCRMTIQNSAGEEYSSAHRVRFMSAVCFIAPPSEDADASSRNLLQRGLTSWYPLVFMGHQYGSQVMNYSANKPSTTTC